MGDNDVLYVVLNGVVLLLSERVFGFGRDGIRASFRPGTKPNPLGRHNTRTEPGAGCRLSLTYIADYPTDRPLCEYGSVCRSFIIIDTISYIAASDRTSEQMGLRRGFEIFQWSLSVIFGFHI